MVNGVSYLKETCSFDCNGMMGVNETAASAIFLLNNMWNGQEHTFLLDLAGKGGENKKPGLTFVPSYFCYQSLEFLYVALINAISDISSYIS